MYLCFFFLSTNLSIDTNQTEKLFTIAHDTTEPLSRCHCRQKTYHQRSLPIQDISISPSYLQDLGGPEINGSDDTKPSTSQDLDLSLSTARFS